MDGLREKTQPPIIYRIGIINDFRETFAFVDYKKFGVVEYLQAFFVLGDHKGFVEKEDRIHIFLNYKKQIATVDSKEAGAVLANLICSCPAEMAGYLAGTQDVLYRAMGVF